jgi:hypothetical protein
MGGITCTQWSGRLTFHTLDVTGIPRSNKPAYIHHSIVLELGTTSMLPYQHTLAEGIAILLIAIGLTQLKDAIFTTGDTYASILGQFASKRETALLLIGFTLGGAYLTSTIQTIIVNTLTTPGAFSFTLGIALWAILFHTNRQVPNWNLASTDDPLLVAIAITATTLLILPFV